MASVPPRIHQVAKRGKAIAQYDGNDRRTSWSAVCGIVGKPSGWVPNPVRPDDFATFSLRDVDKRPTWCITNRPRSTGEPV